MYWKSAHGFALCLTFSLIFSACKGLTKEGAEEAKEATLEVQRKSLKEVVRGTARSIEQMSGLSRSSAETFAVRIKALFPAFDTGRILNGVDEKRVDQDGGDMSAFAGLRTLMRRLRSVELPGDSGKSLQDVTTITMATEFDREPILSPLFNDYPTRPGTGHWVTSSFILVGGGVNGGHTVGAFQTDRLGVGTVNGYNYGQLPVDEKTGQFSPGGVRLSVRSMFPTVVSIFGGSTFSEINGPGPFAAALKS